MAIADRLAQGVIPDIVTLGKPIGNGHPIAAMVTTSAIADEFSAASYYFSTFAGNPVSAAVGMAVLDVMEADGLAARADETGRYLRHGLSGISELGDVDIRGVGLFTGVEVFDGEQRAAAICEGLRNRGVLIGRTGPNRNVLKIRPPLVFESSHADLLLEVMTSVAADV